MGVHSREHLDLAKVAVFFSTTSITSRSSSPLSRLIPIAPSRFQVLPSAADLRRVGMLHLSCPFGFRFRLVLHAVFGLAIIDVVAIVWCAAVLVREFVSRFPNLHRGRRGQILEQEIPDAWLEGRERNRLLARHAVGGKRTHQWQAETRPLQANGLVGSGYACR